MATPELSTSSAQYDRRMQALAMELSEARLKDGNASSAEIVFWLKRATPEERMKEENLRLQNELLKAKTEAIQREQNSSQAYIDAMRAFAGYLPNSKRDIVDAEYLELDDDEYGY